MVHSNRSNNAFVRRISGGNAGFLELLTFSVPAAHPNACTKTNLEIQL
jgi:hypothetical protein